MSQIAQSSKSKLACLLRHRGGKYYASAEDAGKVIRRCFDTTDKTYRNIGIFEPMRTAPHDPTQLDVFMASADTCFSMEVKIGAKSNLNQVVKYALLHCYHGKREGRSLVSRLLYLTLYQEKLCCSVEMRLSTRVLGG